MSFKLYWSLKKRAYLRDPTPRVVRRCGARWLLDPTDWLDLQLLIGRGFETRQMRYLAELSRAHRVRRFFDVGANFGLYSVLLPGMVPGVVRVDAFEPVRAARWRLVANLGLNGLHETVRVHANALSDRAGTGEIAIDPGSTGVSSLSPSAGEIAHRGFSQTESVETVRFDAAFPDLTEPLAVKIDVEGHELGVIDGMAETLARADCVLQIETRPRNAERVEAACARHGYARVAQIDDDRFFLRKG